MRQRDLICKNPACPAYEPVASMTADEQLHCECGAVLELAVFPISVVFTGVLTARYNDPHLENAHRDGHVAWERDPVTKKPRPVRIDTWDAQRSYCKRNGLANPKDFGHNFDVAEDGRTVKSSMGMPGCEV